jgi:hypothetical protein
MMKTAILLLTLDATAAFMVAPLKASPAPPRLAMNANVPKQWRREQRKAKAAQKVAPESPQAAYPSLELDEETVSEMNSFLEEEVAPGKVAAKKVDVTESIAKAVVTVSSAADALSELKAIEKVKDFNSQHAPVEKVKATISAVTAFEKENEVLLKARAVAELGFGAAMKFASAMKKPPAAKASAGKKPTAGKKPLAEKEVKSKEAKSAAPKHKKVRKTFF